MMISAFLLLLSFFFLILRPPPTPPLFPYTTLFRSVGADQLQAGRVDLVLAVADVDLVHARGLEQAPRVVLEPEVRSEEHTSELQSRENLVCRLLLEKKKTVITPKTRKNK